MKFSCPRCSQHISCDEAWGGHEIACPACHAAIVVPRMHAPSPPRFPATRSREVADTPKLPAGVTQVARSTAHSPASIKKIIPRRPRSHNSPLGYAILLAVIAATAGIGYFFGLPLLKEALPQDTGAEPAAGASASQQGGTRGGPLGEVTEAMDISEGLDAGSSKQTALPSATNNAPRNKPR